MAAENSVFADRGNASSVEVVRCEKWETICRRFRLKRREKEKLSGCYGRERLLFISAGVMQGGGRLAVTNIEFGWV